MLIQPTQKAARLISDVVLLKTMNKQRIEYIDFAKGFAILSIVIFHFCQPYTSGIWSKAIMIGGTGVHLFFVLSGFGLGLSSKIKPAVFYKRRFSKILIPYYFVIITIFIINIFYPIYKDNGLYALLGHLFLFKMFSNKLIISFGYHFWFLSTIIQFYLIVPLIFYAKEKLSNLNCIVISLFISICYWAIISVLNLSDQKVYNSFFMQYLWEVVAGVIFADYYNNKIKSFWEQNDFILFFIAIIGISTMALMAVKAGRIGQTFNDIPASLGYLSLSALLFSKGKSGDGKSGDTVLFTFQVYPSWLLALRRPRVVKR